MRALNPTRIRGVRRVAAFVVGVWASALSAAMGAAAQPPPSEAGPEVVQTPAYSVTGTMEWRVRYGLGDARLLAERGYSRGLFFSQNLTLDADVRVRVERPVPGTLALLAQIDNRQPEFLQSLSIRWLAERWSAEFGDFPMGRPGSPFAASDRLLKGFKVQWRPDDALTLSATLSQVSGIKQTREAPRSSVTSTGSISSRSGRTTSRASRRSSCASRRVTRSGSCSRATSWASSTRSSRTSPSASWTPAPTPSSSRGRGTSCC